MFTPNEPKVLSRYLLKVPISPRESQLYVAGIQDGGFELSDFESQLFTHLIQHPIYAAAYDAILSIIQPQSNIRKRIYLMFSILETTPAHADLFLGAHRRRASLRIALVGVCKYLLYVLLGSILYGYQRCKYHLCRLFMTV